MIDFKLVATAEKQIEFRDKSILIAHFGILRPSEF